jgi:hypothetical protein
MVRNVVDDPRKMVDSGVKMVELRRMARHCYKSFRQNGDVFRRNSLPTNDLESWSGGVMFMCNARNDLRPDSVVQPGGRSHNSLLHMPFRLSEHISSQVRVRTKYNHSRQSLETHRSRREVAAHAVDAAARRRRGRAQEDPRVGRRVAGGENPAQGQPAERDLPRSCRRLRAPGPSGPRGRGRWRRPARSGRRRRRRQASSRFTPRAGRPSCTASSGWPKSARRCATWTTALGG